jgi:magnesium-transporting ATPase (P-type)
MTNVTTPTDPSTSDIDSVLRLHGADAALGLTSAEVSRRQAVHGRNELRGKPVVPAWRRLLSQFLDPLIYLLFAAIAIALGAWALDGFDGWPLDAVVITAIVLLNGVLGFVQQARAADAVAALARMTAATSTVVRNGLTLRIPSADLVPGDLLVLAEGDAVGADARLFEASSLRVIEASLTGESDAVRKDAAALPAPGPLGDRIDMVFKGTSVARGTGRAIVVATGMRTEMGGIARMLDATAEAPTPLATEVARIGRMLGIAVLVIATVVVGTILWISDIRTASDVVEVLLLGVSLAVAAVPEGLPAILSVVLAMGIQRMAKHNAIVKNLSSVETLGAASVICTDKTGTLTKSEMTIERIVTASGSTRVTGAGYAPVGRVELDGAELPEGPLRDEQIVVLAGGSLAGDAELREAAGGWSIQGDPTEAAFLVAERKMGLTARRAQRFTRIATIPFTSERKMMSSIERDHAHGDDTVIVTKGAPDVLLARCTHVRVGRDVLPLDAAMRARITAAVDALSGAALRTLGVAYRVLALQEDASATSTMERDLVYVGTVGIIDPPRPEAAAAIRDARRAGIRVIMITGDHPRTAERIAEDLGIADAGAVALTGLQLDAMEEAAFADAVRRTSVFARVAPAHKLRIVAALQADGCVVAMTGDGVNDAPALKAADIGIAMGVTGTDVTREAARMILVDDNFATIVQAVREGRGIFESIRKFLRYLLSSNMGEVLTVFLGVVGAGVLGLGGTGGDVVLPLLATQILWINLVTDSGPALAMGVDPPTGDVMSRKPRGRGERVIDARMWSGVVQIGLVMAVATLLTIDVLLPGGLVEGHADLATARTAGFTVLVIAQLFNCFNARSDSRSAFSHVFVNRWLWAAIAASLALQAAVVHLGFLNLAFGTLPLSIKQWLLCIAMASMVLWHSELRKWAVRVGQNAGAAKQSFELFNPGRKP